MTEEEYSKLGKAEVIKENIKMLNRLADEIEDAINAFSSIKDMRTIFNRFAIHFSDVHEECVRTTEILLDSRLDDACSKRILMDVLQAYRKTVKDELKKMNKEFADL